MKITRTYATKGLKSRSQMRRRALKVSKLARMKAYRTKWSIKDNDRGTNDDVIKLLFRGGK